MDVFFSVSLEIEGEAVVIRRLDYSRRRYFQDGSQTCLLEGVPSSLTGGAVKVTYHCMSSRYAGLLPPEFMIQESKKETQSFL